MLMFGVGFFVTIVSILRLQILIKFGESANLTCTYLASRGRESATRLMKRADDYKNAGYWTSIEINTAMCCACSKFLSDSRRVTTADPEAVPGIRNLLRRFIPRLMGNTVAGSGGGTNLSGRTAISSGTQKGVEVFVRSRDSEDGTFIPLESMPRPTV